MPLKHQLALHAPAPAADLATSPEPLKASACRRPGEQALDRVVARWRTASARLVVCMNATAPGPGMAGELHGVARVADRLAHELRATADRARNTRGG